MNCQSICRHLFAQAIWPLDQANVSLKCLFQAKFCHLGRITQAVQIGVPERQAPIGMALNNDEGGLLTRVGT